MKDEFAEFLKELMDASPHIVEQRMTLSLKSYIDMILTGVGEANKLTPLGDEIMNYFSKHMHNSVTAKKLGESLGYTPKTFNGALKKLVDLKYVEKFGKDPVIYCLTDQGKEYINNLEPSIDKGEKM